MDSSPRETHQQKQQQNSNAAALSGPTSTSQAMHHRSYVGALSLPQQTLMLNASPYSVATQQPWKQLGADASSSAGPPAKPGRGGEEEDESITAHFINVNAGEDIARTLVAFMNQEPREVSVFSASGAVSCAVLQSKTPLGYVKYEGLYNITDMSGTFLNTEGDVGANVTRTGNLSVSLAGPDGKIVEGCVGGMLVAGSQVEVFVGIYGAEGVKLSAASSVPANVFSSTGGGGPGFPQSQGPQRSSVSSEGNASTSLGNTTPQLPHHLPLWPGNNPQ